MDAPAFVSKLITEVTITEIAAAQKVIPDLIGSPKEAEIHRARVLELVARVDRAFLALEVIEGVLEGRHPTGVTSDYLIMSGFPDDWEGQRTIFAAP